MDQESGPTDAQVIARSRADPQTFAVLYERHAKAVFRYAASRLGRELADDLVGETFLVAFERRERFDVSVASAEPWLLGIATRLIRRRRRDEAASWRALDAFAGLGEHRGPAAEEDPSTSADSRIDAAAHTRAIRVTLERLPKRDRDVLLLSAWTDLDSAGVAEALGIPVGTVRSRLHRARRILRTAIEAGGARETEQEHGRTAASAFDAQRRALRTR
ncbi:sigma-70 family RNA polymerase sigma factor [Leucobacter iarius]